MASLNNLAYLYLDLKRYDEAEKLGLEVARLYAELYGENDPDYALALNNLGAVYKRTQRYEEAEKLLVESKNIYKNIYGNEHSAYSALLENLAGLYEVMGNYSSGEELLLQSLDITVNTHGKKHPNYANTIISLARLYKEMGKPDLALTKLMEGIRSVNRVDIGEQINQEWVNSLAQVDYASYQHMNATIYALETISQLLTNKDEQSLLADLTLTLLKRNRDEFAHNKDKLRMLTVSNNWMHYKLKTLNKKTQKDQAFRVVEQNKLVLLGEASNSRQAYQFGALPDSLALKEKLLYKTQSQLGAKLLEQRPKHQKDSFRTMLNQLNLDIKAFKDRVERDFPKYAQLKYKETNLAISDVQKLLGDQTALIEYVIDDSSLYVFYIDKVESRFVELAILETTLVDKVDKLRWSLSNYMALTNDNDLVYTKYSNSAHWFYTNILEPVLVKSANIRHLIIIPDGVLGHLPFETFLIKEAPASFVNYTDLDYLIKDYQISYNYSASLWKENKESLSKQINNNILGIAANYEFNPNVLGARLPAYKQLRKQLKPLAAAEEEVKGLQERFEGYFAFDATANEAMFKQKAGEYGIIHLAMHGLLDNRNQMLSSLAFTENGDSVENNFLQAYEISKMDLNAELVVLSACETGYGKFETGNGIASLARAFMYAGAPSLIVSLWQVNDQATSKIMQDLYQNLATGTNKAEALRQAKLNYLQNARGIAGHPAFWSPFIQMGDSRPVEVAQKGSLWQKMGLIGAAFIFMFGAFAIWSKLKKKEVV